jgi:hypothetical protein
MEHGEERNRTIKRQHDTANMVTASGEKVSIDYCSSELSVAEKYCSHCEEWVSTESLGIIGFAICPQCNNYW